MKAHILLAHPEAKSFNGQLSSVSRDTLTNAGWETSFSDLYTMGFDPCEGPAHYEARQDAQVFHTQSEQRYNADKGTLPPEVMAETEHLLASDLLIVHFPFWWFGMPAILKGWMDRVFVYGHMYRSTMRYDTGICVGKKMIACVTTGASEDNCAFNGREGDTRLHLWPILYPFRYLGFDVLEPEVLHGVGGVAFMEGHEAGLSTMETYKSRWEEALRSLDTRPSVPYNSERDFDQSKRLVPEAPVYSPFIRHHPKAIPE